MGKHLHHHKNKSDSLIIPDLTSVSKPPLIRGLDEQSHHEENYGAQ